MYIDALQYLRGNMMEGDYLKSLCLVGYLNKLVEKDFMSYAHSNYAKSGTAIQDAYTLAESLNNLKKLLLEQYNIQKRGGYGGYRKF